MSRPMECERSRGDTESVDDQVEWFDASSLIYFRPNADGNIVWRLLVGRRRGSSAFRARRLLAGGRAVARFPLLRRAGLQDCPTRPT